MEKLVRFYSLTSVNPIIKNVVLEAAEQGGVMMMKINKLGLWFVVIHSVILVTIAYLDSLNFSRGFGLLAIMGMDIPVAFIIMLLSNFIENICNLSQFILIPALAIIFGGLQWYGIGWLISKLKQRLSPPPKMKEEG